MWWWPECGESKHISHNPRSVEDMRGRPHLGFWKWKHLFCSCDYLSSILSKLLLQFQTRMKIDVSNKVFEDSLYINMIIFITFVLHCLWVKKKWKILQLQGILRTLSKYRLNSAPFLFLWWANWRNQGRCQTSLSVRSSENFTQKAIPTLSGVVFFFDYLFVC